MLQRIHPPKRTVLSSAPALSLLTPALKNNASFAKNRSQAGYEPNTNPATPGAWKDAWEVVGHCSGTGAPTQSPSFDSLASVGTCPDGWEAGGNTKYEEGDMVSVVVSSDPPRTVVYRCKVWPYSGHCGQFHPAHEEGGDLGWVGPVGYCEGSSSPTGSPSFDALAAEGLEGCPEDYVFGGSYGAGDKVAFTVSEAPLRRSVYTCRPPPYDDYCSQPSFVPGTRYSYMAWELDGACENTIAPTMAPTEYDGTCTYTNSEGAEVNVLKYNPLMSYKIGDVVRVEQDRYKCTVEENWCNSIGFAPALSNFWPITWAADGRCGYDTTRK